MLIDTHCHLTYPELAPQLPEVLERAAAAGVQRCITVATDLADVRAALQLAAVHPQIYITAGIHPHEAAKVSDADVAALADLHHGRWDLTPAQQRRIVAIGETGLDFHYDFAPPARQEEVFRAQLALAREVGKPVVIHARKSEARVLDVLADYPELRGRVVFHCFSGDPRLAERVFAAGFWLSFTGVVTFKNADALRDVVRAAPAERIMVETDAPFLTPEPHRKVRPNEPRFVRETAAQLATLRGVALAELAAQTTRNAVRFFQLPEDCS